MSPSVFSAKPSVLRCSRCGKFVDWAEARLQIVCDCRPHLDLPPVLTREARRKTGRPRSRCSAVTSAARASQASARSFPSSETSTIVADMQGDISGALAWKRREDALQIVALATDPMWQRSGVGGYLVAEAETLARRTGARRVVLATTNDNLPALYFYQRRGYRITEVVRNAWRDHAELDHRCGVRGNSGAG